MIQKIRRVIFNEKGQAMTEYVIIICLVAVACLLVMGVFGTNIRTLFATANQSLKGGEAKKAEMQDEGGGKVRINEFTDSGK
jgi:Flp pilus assembly pilin Flp